MTSKYNSIQNLVKNLENDKSEHLVEIEKLKYQLRQAEDEIAQIVSENSKINMKRRHVVDTPGELEMID